MTTGQLGNLADLSGELETRLTGVARQPSPPPSLAELIPEARTYVLVLFDGLGVTQLSHDAATSLLASQVGTLASSFPTTTSVALASLVTGLQPSEHGLTAHLMFKQDLNRVVNTLKWVDLAGDPVSYDYSSVLPRPNLWERLRNSGREPITVQPGGFTASPLSRLLYRGARFEPAYTYEDVIEATISLASEPGRLIFTYVPPVDVAGHVHGLGSPEFSQAMRVAANVWDQLRAGMPPGTTLLGTADHGLIEYRETDKILVRAPRFDDLRFAGDPRGVHVWGARSLIDEFANMAGTAVLDPADLFGGIQLPSLGDGLVLAPSGKVLLPPGFDKRLRCYHGGLDPAEVEVPLLLG